MTAASSTAGERQRLLDLGRVDVHAARDDHVLDAVGDEQEPVLVDMPHVARAVEAVAHDVVAEGLRPR